MTLSPKRHSEIELAFLETFDSLLPHSAVEDWDIQADVVWIDGETDSEEIVSENSLSAGAATHRAFSRVLKQFKRISIDIHDALVEGGYLQNVEAEEDADSEDADEYNLWTNNMLTKELLEQGLRHTGKKEELLSRLRQHVWAERLSTVDQISISTYNHAFFSFSSDIVHLFL